MYDAYNKNLRFNIQRDKWRDDRIEWCKKNMSDDCWVFNYELDVLTILNEKYYFWYENTFKTDERLRVTIY